jgi:hypothetical protein
VSYLDTLFVNGHDLRGLSNVVIVGTIDFRAPGDRRGEDEVVPGRRGVLIITSQRED